MKAIVTCQFSGRPDKDVFSRIIKVGEVIDGDLAMVAVANGWADAEGETAAKDNGAGAAIDLEKLTVKQLQELAATRSIDIAGASKKAEIIEAINKAIDANADATAGTE